MNEASPAPVPSPRWSTTTRLVVSLTIVAVIAALVIRFRNFVGPLLLAFLLSYLLYPAIVLIQRRLNLSWRAAVNLVFLVILILGLGLLTMGGIGLVAQIQSLIAFIQINLTRLPELAKQMPAWAARWGIDLTQIDPSLITDQLLAASQGLLDRIAALLGSLAGSAALFLAWTFFVLIISYFILIESGGLRAGILKLDIPHYHEDIRRLGNELERIWNAFLRGQIIIFLLTTIIYFLVLSLLGVRYATGLSLAAGFARFVPYVGPAINWTALALVAFFQTYKPFGLEPLYYMLIVLGICLLIDQVFDNLIQPRILANVLRVHPAAVLVTALIAADLMGVLGVVLAAPILATLQLLLTYTFRKMLDLDPWPVPPETSAPSARVAWVRQVWTKWRSRRPPSSSKGAQHES